jgi:hypothetical protein
VQPELPSAVEVDRTVNVHGGITIGGRHISVGTQLAGQRVRIRLDSILMHVIDEAGQLQRTLRSPLTPAARARLRGGRPAGPPPPPDPNGVSVDRVVCIQGTIQVAGQTVRVGRVHSRKVVRVLIEDATLTVHDGQAVIVAVPRRSTTDVNRFRAKHHIRPSRNLGATHEGAAAQ